MKYNRKGTKIERKNAKLAEDVIKKNERLK